MAYLAHVQHIALALHEVDALGAYYTGGVDNYRNSWSKKLREMLKKVPAVDRQLVRRRITTVPDDLIYNDWSWDGLRALSSRLGLSPIIQDWLWERSEHRLDGRCAELIRRPEFNAFFGVEHGCLSTVRTAKKLGKPTVVAFLSPHHTFREKWVDAEYEQISGLLTPATQRLLQLGRRRDARRDDEARLADVIHTNSSLTSQSLVDAGFAKEKMVTVPYGSPAALPETSLPNALPKPLRFIYAGTISVRKGAHYLIDAWKKLYPGPLAELHLYGIPQLPDRCFNGIGENLIMHGSVSQPALFAAYQRGAILVFPTLCDGFGLVVVEALAHGLPVITTRNAGAADLIEDGKNGFVVPPRDSEALAERLVWCIRHPENLLEMRRHALETTKRWTWEQFRITLRQGLADALGLPFNAAYDDTGGHSSDANPIVT